VERPTTTAADVTRPATPAALALGVRKRPFDELTPVGRRRRLSRLAGDVLQREHGVRPVALHAVAGHWFNTVFRVDEQDGSRSALRVGDAHRIHVEGVEEVEVAWLDALAADLPTVVAARVLRTPDGRPWTTAERADVTGARVCTRFTWARGRRLSDRLDERGMRAGGRILAELHEHAAGYRLPFALPAGLRADRVAYFGDTSRILAYRARDSVAFNEAIARVQERIDLLWTSPPHSPHLLHGDLGAHNLMRWHDQVRVLDFQDLQFGFDVQDLGIALADMTWHEADLIEPFMRGYADVRPLPDLSPDLVAALRVGRSLNMINLGLNLRRPRLERFLELHERVVMEWMRPAS
jgi:Ser/Thr protein kinase RdoA (MazF antagonist)